MRKRNGIILVVVLASALVVAGYFIRKEKQIVVVDPWTAVPSDAFLIIETPDFPELLTRATDRNGIMARLSDMKWAATVTDAAAALDSITGGRDVREVISNRKVILSFHIIGQGPVSAMAVMNTGPSFSYRHLTNLCEKSGGSVTSARELGGARTFEVAYGKGSTKSFVYMALTSGIVIISPSGTLVENALNNKETGSDIRHQQGFTPVVAASGKEADNMFILFRNLPRVLQSFVSKEDISKISSAAIAAGGDLTAREEGLFLSGFVSTAGAGVGADRLRDAVPAESGVQELLPRGTLRYTTVMSRASISGTATADPSSINATDLALSLSPFTGTEVTTAMLPLTEGAGRVILFRMTDRQAADSVLRERLTAKYRTMGMRESHFLARVKNENGEETFIYRMPFTGVASILSGEASTAGADEWVLFSRSYMVFAASPDLLALIKRESDSDNTLINDVRFREMEKTLPTRSSFVFYVSGAALRSVIGEIVTPSALASMTDKAIASIEGIGLSLTPSNDMIYTSLSVRYHDPSLAQSPSAARTINKTAITSATGIDAGLNLIWKVRLDAPLSAKPFLFLNHNTGATEIFVQDQKNNIYLVSSSGKILWKALIREKITGEVFMIDYYRNGKNQLLFSGRNYLHLIDRNGNYVDRFPVKLRSPAANTLALFDYENNKDYRLCIAGDDRKIYVYDRSGTPVRGWNLFTTRGKVTDPVVFFRVRGKDYLFAADEQSVYLLDRMGNIRVNLQNPVKKASGSAVRLVSGDTQTLVFTEPDGSIINLSFDGTVKRRTVSSFSTDHRFDCADINGDGLPEYIFLDRGMLRVYSNDGVELYTKTFDTDLLYGPVIFSFSPSDRKTGIYEVNKKQLHLTGRAGAPVQGFPVPSGPYFTVGRYANKSSWNLFANQNDSYLYNYELSANK
ncbi:MAG: hypothetical protein L0Y37_02905 [Bacteroidales bacterium]|nr:hypothetical protein [Bacteroidales bacterium]